MLSIRLPLAVIITAILSVAAYFTNTALLGSPFSPFVAPVFVIATFLLLFIPTLIAANPNSTPNVESKSHKAVPTETPTTPTTESSNETITTLYVGNLPYKANEMTVKTLFEEIGTVTSVRLMKDRKTGRRKGFGFVEVDAAKENEFISKLNDSEFMDRSIKVRPAKDKTE
jgi:RNA recognition motif-containing protein